MTENDLGDPGDRPFFLRHNGWNRLSMKDVDSEFWFRKLSENSRSMQVIIELTPGGRRKFFVENPPDAFREAAHEGRCLTSRGVADGETLFRVHFNTKPESIADGVRTLRTMLAEGA